MIKKISNNTFKSREEKLEEWHKAYAYKPINIVDYKKFKKYFEINKSKGNFIYLTNQNINRLASDLAKIAKENKEVITEGKVSIENTTVFIDGLSLEQFIDAEICQRIKKYNETIVKIYVEVQE